MLPIGTIQSPTESDLMNQEEKAMSRIFLLLSLVLLSLNVSAQSWQDSSSDKTIAVLELFTSEGCGLCPAADRWVEHLPEQGINEQNLITLSFHIDYLNDKKGWIDKFAKPEFADRQRQLARLNLFQTVYTPEFIISGEVIHNWRKHAKKVIHTVNDFDAEADIQMRLEQSANALSLTTQTTVRGDANKEFSKLYLAVLEDDVTNKVYAGDNAGATFNHQNLVRTWLGPFDLNVDGKTQHSTTINLDKSWNKHKLSLVAIVQNLDDGYVLQGLSVPLVKK